MCPPITSVDLRSGCPRSIESMATTTSVATDKSNKSGGAVEARARPPVRASSRGPSPRCQPEDDEDGRQGGIEQAEKPTGSAKVSAKKSKATTPEDKRRERRPSRRTRRATTLSRFYKGGDTMNCNDKLKEDAS